MGEDIKNCESKDRCEYSIEEIGARVEVLVFASQEPLSFSVIYKALDLGDGVSESLVQEAIDVLIDFYKDTSRGFEFVKLAESGYHFRSKKDYSLLIERMFEQKPRPLSRAAQETLAIVAYRQPVTRADVEFIRGVDAGSIIKNLLERDLIACVGRKEDVGRPMMFGTTKEFLKVFGLSSLNDLPTLESFQPSLDSMQSAYEKISNIHAQQVDSDIKQAKTSLAE
jgi:segregation and condensation protein B